MLNRLHPSSGLEMPWCSLDKLEEVAGDRDATWHQMSGRKWKYGSKARIAVWVFLVLFGFLLRICGVPFHIMSLIERPD